MLYCDLKSRIAAANLAELAEIAEKIDDYQFTGAVLPVHSAKLVEPWLRKVLLLVNGIEDVNIMLRSARGTLLYHPLIESYGARTKTIDNILTLITHLWIGAECVKSTDFDELYRIESLLRERALGLIADSRYGLGHIEELALAVYDSFGNGSGSRASEDIVNALAIAKLGQDFDRALAFANNFYLSHSKNRFYEAYVSAHGFEDRFQATLLADALETPQHGGQELADAILGCIDNQKLAIAHISEARLILLSEGAKVGPITDHRRLIDLLAESLAKVELEDEVLPSRREMVKLMAYTELLCSQTLTGKYSDPVVMILCSPARLETHNHPGRGQRLAGKSEEGAYLTRESADALRADVIDRMFADAMRGLFGEDVTVYDSDEGFFAAMSGGPGSGCRVYSDTPQALSCTNLGECVACDFLDGCGVLIAKEARRIKADFAAMDKGEVYH
jgi:hypothetical protein